jgi:large subunit ribosomal protein L4
MELQVLSGSGQPSGESVSVADATFARDFNETLVHQVVVAYLAGGRGGNQAQKNRSRVRGGGAKPWRQKGTGRARAGTIRGPLWRGGGVTFAARPRDHSQKVNKKMYRAAMRSIFSELLRQQRLLIIDALTVDEPKTKLMAARLQALCVEGSVLLVIDQPEEKLLLSARNLPRVAVSDPAGLDPVSLIRFDTVVVTVAALERIGEWLA